MKKIVLSLMVIGLGSMVCAVEKPNDVNKNKVALEAMSHAKRIEILQKADSCIKAAQTQEDYKKCEETEKQGRENLKTEMFAEHKKMVIKGIDERIAKANTFKTCANAAKNGDEMKACYPKKEK